MRRVSSGVRVAALAAAAAVLFATSAGHAAYKVKNSGTFSIYVAQDRVRVCDWDCEDGWRSAGWYLIAPGGTATISGYSANTVLFTFYAEDHHGHTWHGPEWVHSVCTPWEAFNHCTPSGSFIPACDEGTGRRLDYGAMPPPEWCCGLSIFCGSTTVVINLK